MTIVPSAHGASHAPDGNDPIPGSGGGAGLLNPRDGWAWGQTYDTQTTGDPLILDDLHSSDVPIGTWGNVAPTSGEGAGGTSFTLTESGLYQYYVQMDYPSGLELADGEIRLFLNYQRPDDSYDPVPEFGSIITSAVAPYPDRRSIWIAGVSWLAGGTSYWMWSGGDPATRACTYDWCGFVIARLL